jgi:peroxiredoxin
VSVVALLYDPYAQLEKFRRKYNISYSLLSDENSEVIMQFGILNPTYDINTRYYGVPYPGIFLINSEGIIKAKFAEENYRDRPLLQDLVTAVDRLVDIDSP